MKSHRSSRYAHTHSGDNVYVLSHGCAQAAQATIKGLSEQLKAAQDEAKSERASAAREVERASKTAAKSRDAAVAEVERQRSEALNDMDRR